MTKKQRIYLLSALTPMVIMTLVWMFNQHYPFGNKSLMAVDFGQQFIDFFIYLKHTFLSGDFSGLIYSFEKSIGGNMIGTTAYYLMSPFNIIYVLFPISMINMANFVIILLRYGFMGLTFSHFLIKRHQALNYAWPLTVILASAYALNGYHVSYQMVPIFYDAMIMLPLVLIGVEEVLDGDKPFRYILLLAVTLLIQYYMGYMISLFIVIYSVFYLLIRRGQTPWESYWKVCVNRILRMAVFSILAIGLIAIFFLPNIQNLLDSKGALGSTNQFAWALQINPMDIFSKLMIGAFDNDSWPAGPNLPNIYVGSLALFGLVMFYISKNVSRQEKLAASGVLFLFILSFVHEFTSKIWHLGQNPAGFFYRFSWITAFFMLLLAYKGLRHLQSIKGEQVFFGGGLVFIVGTIVGTGTYSFLTLEQKQFSVFLFACVLFIYYLAKSPKWRWILLFLLTSVELGANAAISQGRINYTDALKFENAIEVIDKAITPIRPNNKDFYRISKNFTRSKNDPFMINYPGLTLFSSNLEVSIRDLFTRLGNNDVDATTYYFGTPLTDALLAVKYYVANQPVMSLPDNLRDKTYVFGDDVPRDDIVAKNHLVETTDRLKVYQIDETLPVGFGVNTDLVAINLQQDQPVENQNLIAQALAGNKDTYMENIGLPGLELENMEATAPGSPVYRLKPGVTQGKLRVRFTPTDNSLYYVVIPQTLSTINNDIQMQLNENYFPHRPKFTNTQLLNVAHDAQGQTQVFELVITRPEEINLTGFQLAKMDPAKISQLIANKVDEGLKVESWGNTFFKGRITIGEDSQWVYTSIPYDEGWSVKVDGQPVRPVKIWDALLGFEVSSGQHQVTLNYTPKGFRLGAAVTLVSVAVVVGLGYYDRRYGIRAKDGDVSEAS